MRINRKLLLAGSFVLALVVTPLAIAAGEGDPLLGGARNPSPDERQALSRETEIIANTSTYGTRQSNKSNNGGGAIYGCRSGAGGTAAGNEPCLRANNLSAGRAFEFTSDGAEVGRIEAANAASKPFTTNATGVADGLNADRVDGRNADELVNEARGFNRFAAVTAEGALTADRGAATAARAAVGVYDVTFDADVNTCAYTATVVGGETAGGFAFVEPTGARTVRVRTRSADASAPADRAFHLVAIC
jgi:hypothetical protein